MRAIRASALYGAGTVLLLGAAFPLFWMLSTALKPSGEIFATPRFVPLHPTLENFQRLFADTAFLVFFRNSVLVAGGRDKDIELVREVLRRVDVPSAPPREESKPADSEGPPKGP